MVLRVHPGQSFRSLQLPRNRHRLITWHIVTALCENVLALRKRLLDKSLRHIHMEPTVIPVIVYIENIERFPSGPIPFRHNFQLPAVLFMAYTKPKAIGRIRIAVHGSRRILNVRRHIGYFRPKYSAVREMIVVFYPIEIQKRLLICHRLHRAFPAVSDDRAGARKCSRRPPVGGSRCGPPHRWRCG